VTLSSGQRAAGSGQRAARGGKGKSEKRSERRKERTTQFHKKISKNYKILAIDSNDIKDSIYLTDINSTVTYLIRTFCNS